MLIWLEWRQHRGVCSMYMLSEWSLCHYDNSIDNEFDKTYVCDYGRWSLNDGIFAHVFNAFVEQRCDGVATGVALQQRWIARPQHWWAREQLFDSGWKALQVSISPAKGAPHGLWICWLAAAELVHCSTESLPELSIQKTWVLIDGRFASLIHSSWGCVCVWQKRVTNGLVTILRFWWCYSSLFCWPPSVLDWCWAWELCGCFYFFSGSLLSIALVWACWLPLPAGPWPIDFSKAIQQQRLKWNGPTPLMCISTPSFRWLSSFIFFNCPFCIVSCQSIPHLMYLLSCSYILF